jgi:glutamyl aminopeptidase
MNEELFKRIKEITELQATSGFEDEVRDYMRKEMTPLVDRVETDGLGGIFGIRENEDKNAPRIMVAGHMDEIGFMLSRINDNGLLNVIGLGGWNPYVIQAQRFTLITRKGEKIPVVSGSVPPHLLRGDKGAQTTPKIEDIFFDAGFSSKEEAESFGIRPGDYIIPQAETILTANKKNIISKAWDNRYGCLMALEALRTLKNEKLPSTLIAGANVQEEVGLRGAHVSTTQFKPDLFFAVDCSPANDLDAAAKAKNAGQLGNGALVRLFDPGHILLPRMREFIRDTASTHSIKIQDYVGMGGTDAGAAHVKNDGVPSTTVGVVGRYIHSHQTLFNIEDFEAAQELLVQMIRSLDKSTVDTIVYGK